MLLKKFKNPLNKRFETHLPYFSIYNNQGTQESCVLIKTLYMSITSDWKLQRLAMYYSYIVLIKITFKPNKGQTIILMSIFINTSTESHGFTCVKTNNMWTLLTN